MAISIDLSIGNSSGGGGGSVNTGVLQVSGGGALSGTLQTITDQSSNASPLQLSTTEVAIPTGIFTVDAQMRFNGTIYNTIDDIVKFGGAIRTATFASIGGTFTNSARLHVRGDGTNPIALFQNGAGVGRISIADVGTLTTTVASGQANFSFGYVGNATYLNMNSNGVVTHYSTTAGSGIETFRVIADGVASHTSGAMRILQVSGAGFSPSSGTGIYRPFEINYTLNASGANTGTATGIYLNATETALNGMGHNLMDLQVGGESRIKVDNAGRVFTGNSIIIQIGSSLSWSDRTVLNAPADGNLRITNSAGNNFGLLQLGGTTNAFPAIKRNGADIDFRLADDSGYADVVGKTFTSYASGVNSFVIDSSVASSGHGFVIQSYNTGLTGVALSLYSTSIFQADATAGGGVTLRGSGDSHTAYASALFAMKSTTKGFLPPTMTTTEVNAIASPAEGLVVFNTTISHLCVYQGGAWVKINHSPM